MPPEFATEPSDVEPTMLDTEPVVRPGLELSDAPLVRPETPPQPEALPVSSTERYFAVDVLRGFALLGILAMNIVSFGWPWPAYGNPMRGGGFHGARSRRLVLQSSGLRREDDDDFLDAFRRRPGLDGSAGRGARGAGSRGFIIAGSSFCWRSGWFTRT